MPPTHKAPCMPRGAQCASRPICHGPLTACCCSCCCCCCRLPPAFPHPLRPAPSTASLLPPSRLPPRTPTRPHPQVVEYLRAHDDVGKGIAEAAADFAIQHLNKDARMCYLFTLITEFAKTFK